MRLNPRRTILHIILALLTGLLMGLAYSWFISPVTYIDASPAILRADFKDQYRSVIAASYATTHDLPRARARLELLGDTDPTGELSAQAQRMLASGTSLAIVQPLAQLATDLRQGTVSIPVTSTSFIAVVNTPTLEIPFANITAQIDVTESIQPTLPSTSLSFEQTPLAPQQLFTSTPRPTATLIRRVDAPFTRTEQETVCNPDLQPGLLQFILLDSRRRQVAGIEIIVTWSEGEDRFFTGFKPELGNGYADFVMQADTTYSARVAESGAFISDILIPTCTDANGTIYLGGLAFTFQQ